jgi:hypothetical protein
VLTAASPLLLCLPTPHLRTAPTDVMTSEDYAVSATTNVAAAVRTGARVLTWSQMLEESAGPSVDSVAAPGSPLSVAQVIPTV